MECKNVLILNGSVRKKGTSYSFARTLNNLVVEKGSLSQVVNIIEYQEEGKDFEKLKSIISNSDIIILSVPLYVDSLPQAVIWFFEKLFAEMKNSLKGKFFFSVGQCAFPYTEVLEPIMGCCRCFAESMEMKYLGGLSYGGGVMINGVFLENFGKKGQKITKAFNLALENILKGKEISPECQENLENRLHSSLSKPMALILNHMSKKAGRKNGVKNLRKNFI